MIWWHVTVSWKANWNEIKSERFCIDDPDCGYLMALGMRAPGCETWIEIVEAEES